MAFNSRSRQLWYKKQVTRGTFVAVTSADQKVIVYDRGDIKRDYGHTGGADRADGTFNKGRSYSGKKSASIDFKAELQFSGVLATSPKVFDLLEGCGCYVTNTTNAIATWTGVPNCQCIEFGLPEYSCGSTPIGLVEHISSAAGSFEIGAESVGAPVYIKFNFTGKQAGQVDIAAGAMVAPAGFDTAVCEKFLGSASTFTMNSIVYRVYSWNAVVGQDLQAEENSADVTGGIDTGIFAYGVKGCNPQLTLTVERVGIATNDIYAAVEGDTTYATATLATAHFDILFTVAQVTDIQAANSNGTSAETLTVKFDTLAIKQMR